MIMDMVLIIFMLASYSACKTVEWNSLTIFLQELVNIHNWHYITIVNCNNSMGLVYELLQWQKNLGSNVYIQLLSEDKYPIQQQTFSSVTPIIILPACKLRSRVFTKLVEKKMPLFSWWFLITEDASSTINSHYFKDLPISAIHNANLVTFKQEAKEVIGKIYDIYIQQNENILHTQQTATWVYNLGNRSLYWNSYHVPSFSSQLNKMHLHSRSLNGIILRVGVLVGKPDYSYDCGIQQDKLGHVVELNGYSYLLLKVLQNILHFRITYVESDTWGQQDNKEDWVGLIGLLVENKADIIVCSPTITTERTSVVQFLHPTQYSSVLNKSVHIGRTERKHSLYWQNSFALARTLLLDTMVYNPGSVLLTASFIRRMLVYRASGLPLTQDVFLQTFTGSLWLVCLLIALALLAGFLHLTSYTSIKYQSERPWTWVEVTLWAVAATCQQGCTKEPQGVSSRTVFIVGYLTCYLLYTWFAAGVTSLLAVQGKDTHLQLEDVVQLGADFSAIWDGLLPDYFMDATDSAANTLYTTQLTKEYNEVHNMETLFLQLRKNGRVAMATKEPLQHYISTRLSTDEACQLTLSPVSGTYHMKGWAVQKNFSYFNMFNYWLLRMQETGIYEAALYRSIGRLPVCGSGPGYSSAGLGHVTLALCILAAGIIAALLILFLEIIWHFYNNQH